MTCGTAFPCTPWPTFGMADFSGRASSSSLRCPERLTWRRWRPFRTYANPIPVPAPREVLEVSEPRTVWESRLGDVRIIRFRAGTQIWEMAAVTIDTTVVTTALAEAKTWTRQP